MTVQQLIEILRRCAPDAQVSFDVGGYSEFVGFIEFNKTHNNVLLYDSEPDWDGGDDGVFQVNILEKQDGFAKVEYWYEEEQTATAAQVKGSSINP